MTKAYKNDHILIISDTHFPYNHKGVFNFLKNLKDTCQPERVFHLGDLTDQYMFSSYPKIPEADGVSTELRKVRQCVERLGELFPDMIIMSSNHDDRVYKKSRLGGIPKELLLPYKSLIGADKFNWRWVEDYIIRLPNKQHLYMCHTKAGKAANMSKLLGMNVAVGHHHSEFGVAYHGTPLGTRWGVDCGCLIGDDHYAFAYNKQSLIRPVLGCVRVYNSTPILEKMG